MEGRLNIYWKIRKRRLLTQAFTRAEVRFQYKSDVCQSKCPATGIIPTTWEWFLLKPLMKKSHFSLNQSRLILANHSQVKSCKSDWIWMLCENTLDQGSPFFHSRSNWKSISGRIAITVLHQEILNETNIWLNILLFRSCWGGFAVFMSI